MDAHTSARMLDHIDRWNMFLVPLDQYRQWYRYHHLFAELLRNRLAATEPETVRLIQRRAAEWHARAGDDEETVEYALAGGAFEHAASLLVPRLAAAWGLDPASLGLREGGTGMESAASLQLPPKTVLLEYLRRWYALQEQAIAIIDERQFQERRQDHNALPDQTVGYWVMNHLIHEWEHLGMIRSLVGLHALSTRSSP
jgi:hypothetical protein